MAKKNKADMLALWESSTFYGESATWLESMYETYISDPAKLPDKWRLYFDAMSDADDERNTSQPESQLASGGNGGNGTVISRAKSNEPFSEHSPREMHDYFVNYAKHKHTRGFAALTSFDHEKKTGAGIATD